MTPYLTASDLWALVACGDLLLASRLRNYPILERLQLEPSNVGRFSSFVAHGRLDKIHSLRLSEILPSTALTALSSPQLLARLPYLRSFTIQNIMSPHVLFAPTEKWTKGAGTHQDFDLSVVMPSLESFSFSIDEFDHTQQKMRLSFPPTLHSIQLTGHYGIIAAELVYPPHLTILNLDRARILSRETISRLPKTITSIEAAFAQDNEWSHNGVFTDILEGKVFPHVPAHTLRELLDCNDPDWSFYASHERYIDHLEDLKALHAARFCGWGCVRLLPNLAHLRIVNYYVDGRPWCQPLFLPSTLTSLGLGLAAFNAPPLLCSVAWPPRLTKLFSSSRYVDYEQLPLSLTEVSSPNYHFISPPMEVLAFDPSLTLTPISNTEHSSKPSTLSARTAAPHNLPSDMMTVAMANMLLVWDREAPVPPFLEGLHTLKYHSFDKATTISHISCFPRSLTFLQVGFLHFTASDLLPLKRDYSCPQHFPNALLGELMLASPEFGYQSSEETSMNSTAAISSSGLTALPPLWPPNLQTFKALHSNMLPPQIIPCLPPTLTHYSIDEIAFDYRSVDLVAKILPHMLQMVSKSILAEAMRVLWEVSEHRFFDPRFWFGDDCFEPLFPITTTLDLDHTSICRIERFSGFQKLHTIIFGQTKIDEPDHLFQYLPPTVTCIDMSRTKAEVSEYLLITMPPNVTRLEVKEIPITLACVHSTFPSGAFGSELNLSTLEAAGESFFKSFGDRIKVSFHFVDMNLTPFHWVQRLPSIITSIDLNSDTSDERFYSILPDSLTSLRIAKPTKLTDAVVPLFPASLLYFDATGDMALSYAGIKALPSLISLKLPSNSRLTYEIIPILPRTLEVLHINSARITNTHIEHLPPHMTDLQIAWADIEPEALALLPRGLLSLNIQHAEFLAEADPSPLPPTLTRLLAPPGMMERVSAENFPLLVKGEAEAPSFESGLFDF